MKTFALRKYVKYNMETMFLIFLFVLTDITYGLPRVQTIYIKTECDFEQHNLCGYTQGGKAEFNWTWHSGSTPSNATGPSADHTTGSSAGHYIYIETSDPRKLNDAAVIMSPIYVPMSEGQWCVTFWYHMYGADVKSLNVYMLAFSHDNLTIIWKKSFDQGNTWKAASVTVEPGGVFQLLFEGVRGKGFLGDIAIDDVSVANGACKVKEKNSADCSFDYDFCGWSQEMIDPLFYWERTNDNEPYKGQLGDHNGKGIYIYTRYLKPQFFWNNYAWKDLSAFIFSPPLPKTSEKGSCFSLWYYIPSGGRLNIYTLSNDHPVPILHWSKSASQSNKWQHVALSIDKLTDYTIAIEGSFPKYTDIGSIAIDGIRFEETQCESSSHETQPDPHTINIQTVDNYIVCDFDQEYMCGYSQDKKLTAEFNWTWNSGSTRSTRTGPSADHTTGTGHYIYIETSDPRKPNEAARILSHGYRGKSTGPLCVTFWYHMYGSDVNTLNVYMFEQSDISAKVLIWTRSLNQGNEWKKAAVTVKPDSYFQLLFEGVRGNGFRGDIAVDDVSVATGTCTGQAWGVDICDDNECVLLSSVSCGSESVHFESREMRGVAKLPKYEINQRTIGGSTAAPGEVPWQVGVRLNNQTLCGGTILGDYWILSAAHCFSPLYNNRITVRVGDLDNSVLDYHEEEFGLELIITHPLYNETTHDYDLALLKIKPNRGGASGIKFSEHVKPACLPDKTTSYVGEECLVSGWGFTRKRENATYEGFSTERLQHAVVPVNDAASCREMYNRDDIPITPRMICAGYPEGGIDTCSGDSGGGLVCKKDRSFSVIGVTSFGKGCADPDFPGVYADVQELIPWIHETIINSSKIAN